jgi:hypothetical protein
MDVMALACRCVMMYMYKIRTRTLRKAVIAKIRVFELDHLNEVGCLFNPSRDPHQFNSACPKCPMFPYKWNGTLKF